MKSLLILILFHTLSAFGVDLYSDFGTLALHEKENLDFRISVEDKQSPISILVIHGGKIEPGTSELARAMKGNFNSYYFEGIKSENNFSLHITSTHFDEPQALNLASRSAQCLSLHGYRGSGKKSICVGGGNTELAKRFVQRLQSFEDLEVIYPCTAYPGKDKRNIVNRCHQQGVQIEMNDELRDAIIASPAYKNELATALSEILSQL